MPVLKNPRHERFAQELAKGKSQTEAYLAVGYQANEEAARRAASRLMTNVDVASRVAELQQRGADKAEVTVASLLEEAEAARALAMAIENPGAAVAAIREKGVLSGKRVERSERGKPGDFDNLTDDELDRFIASRQGAAGAGLGGERSSQDQKGVRGKSGGLH